MADPQRIVIVGAGEAGMHAAMTLRALGHDGPLTLVSDEAHQPYERPPLSKFGADGPEFRPIASADHLDGLTLLLGDATHRIDRDAKLVETASGQKLPYDKLLLATGAAARPLPGAGDTFVLRTIEDARAIRDAIAPGKTVVVFGAGLIGTELAAAARVAGAKIILLEAGPRIAARALPEQLGDRLAARHVAEGVDLRLNAQLPTLNGKTLTFPDGEVVEADLIVAGIGSVPNVALADAAGLAADNGIVVDTSMRTSDAAIFAAGDCCTMPLDHFGLGATRLESWRSAQDQGRRAARAMLGLEPEDDILPWFWSDQFDLGLQVTGLFGCATTLVTREIDAEKLLVFGLDGNGVLVAAGGIGPGTSIARDIKMSEMMVRKRAKPEATLLADPAASIKSIMAKAA